MYRDDLCCYLCLNKPLSFFALTCACININVNGKDHIRGRELIVGLQQFLQGMSFVQVTLGEQKITLSQNVSS